MFKLFDLYKKSFSGLSQQTWMLALVMLLNRTGAMVIPFLGVYAIRELNFTEAMVGIVLSSFGVGCVLGNYVGGKLTDNFGSYKVQLFSLILTGPIFLVISFCKGLISLSICVGILGLVAELFRPANSISITLFAKKENITRAFTLNRLALNLGFSFGPALGGFLSLFSFKWLFYGNALGISITALVFYLYFSKQNPKNTLENKTFLESEKKEGSSVWKDYKFLMFCVVNVLYALVFSQLLSILPVFYKNEIKMSEFEIGTILAYSGIFVVLTEMLFIYLTERRFSIIKNMFIGVFFLTLTYFSLLFSNEIWMLYLSITLLCVSEILFMPYSTTYTAQSSNELNKGQYMGIQGMTFSIALIITPILSTMIISKYGFSKLWIFNIVITILASILLLILSKLHKKSF